VACCWGDALLVLLELLRGQEDVHHLAVGLNHLSEGLAVFGEEDRVALATTATAAALPLTGLSRLARLTGLTRLATSLRSAFVATIIGAVIASVIVTTIVTTAIVGGRRRGRRGIRRVVRQLVVFVAHEAFARSGECRQSVSCVVVGQGQDHRVEHVAVRPPIDATLNHFGTVRLTGPIEVTQQV
jgi:hypothetical protein